MAVFLPSPSTNQVISTASACGPGATSLPRLGSCTGRPSRPLTDSETSSSSSYSCGIISCSSRTQNRISAETLLALDRAHPGRPAGAVLAGTCPSTECCSTLFTAPHFRGPRSEERSSDPTPAEDIRIMQLNLHKSKLSANELNKWEFDVALVQEPNLQRGGRVNLVQRPKSFYSKGGARAAVVINQGLNYWPVESLSTKDLAIVALETNHGTILVASVYLDITIQPPTPEVEKMVNYCNQKKIPLIMGIDANAHSPFWGEPSSNSRGSILEDWILQKELYVHNVGCTPTFAPITDVRHTIIDITLSNSWAQGRIHEWEVIKNENTFSDHRRIKFAFKANIQMENHLTRPLRKVRWNEFTTVLERMGKSYGSSSQMTTEELTYNITSNISRALDSVAPRKRYTISPQNVWWN